MNGCDFFFHLAGFAAKVFRNAFCDSGSADRTQPRLHFSGSQRLRVAVAAGKAAGAAVCAGKQIADGFCFFIFWNSHYNGGKRQNQPAEQPDSRNDQNWNQYFIHLQHLLTQHLVDKPLKTKERYGCQRSGDQCNRQAL